MDGLDWIFFQFKLDKTGHGLLIFGSYLDSFYLDMDFDPFPGVSISNSLAILIQLAKKKDKTSQKQDPKTLEIKMPPRYPASHPRSFARQR